MSKRTRAARLSVGMVLAVLVGGAAWVRPTTAQSPQPTPTPAVTATPAGPRPTPTPAPTPVPQDVAQRLAPDCPGEHRDGPRQLTVRQPTRILVTCTVRNPLAEPVDYSATMVFTLGERAAVVDGGAQRGQVAVVGNEIRWGAFVLQPGESASAFAVVEVSPAQADAGRPVVLFTSTRTTAQLAGGGVVTFVAGPFTTAEVAGLLAGGLVTTAPAAAPAAPAQPARPAPPAAGLPRTGTGAAGEPAPAPGFLLALAALAAPAIVTALRARR